MRLRLPRLRHTEVHRSAVDVEGVRTTVTAGVDQYGVVEVSAYDGTGYGGTVVLPRAELRAIAQAVDALDARGDYESHVSGQEADSA